MYIRSDFIIREVDGSLWASKELYELEARVYLHLGQLSMNQKGQLVLKQALTRIGVKVDWACSFEISFR